MDDWDVCDNLDFLPKQLVDDLMYKYDALYFPLSNGKLWSVSVENRAKMRNDYFTKRTEFRYTFLIDSKEYVLWIIDFDMCGTERCWCDIPSTLHLKISDQTSIYPRWIQYFDSSQHKDSVVKAFFDTDSVIPLSMDSISDAFMIIEMGFDFRCKSFENKLGSDKECDLCGESGNIRMNCCYTNESSKWLCVSCLEGLLEDEQCPWCREPFNLLRAEKDKRWDPFIKDLC